MQRHNELVQRNQTFLHGGAYRGIVTRPNVSERLKERDLKSIPLPTPLPNVASVGFFSSTWYVEPDYHSLSITRWDVHRPQRCRYRIHNISIFRFVLSISYIALVSCSLSITRCDYLPLSDYRYRIYVESFFCPVYRCGASNTILSRYPPPGGTRNTSPSAMIDIA